MAELCSMGVDGQGGPSGLIQLFSHARDSAPGTNLNPQPPAGKARAQVSSRAVALGQGDLTSVGPPARCQPGFPSLLTPKTSSEGLFPFPVPHTGREGQPDTVHGSQQSRPLQRPASSSPASSGCSRALGSHPAGASSSPPCQPLRNLPAEASLSPTALQRGVPPSRWL